MLSPMPCLTAAFRAAAAALFLQQADCNTLFDAAVLHSGSGNSSTAASNSQARSWRGCRLLSCGSSIRYHSQLFATCTLFKLAALSRCCSRLLAFAHCYNFACVLCHHIASRSSACCCCLLVISHCRGVTPASGLSSRCCTTRLLLLLSLLLLLFGCHKGVDSWRANCRQRWERLVWAQSMQTTGSTAVDSSPKASPSLTIQMPRPAPHPQR